jgi:hypothetical protein
MFAPILSFTYLVIGRMAGSPTHNLNWWNIRNRYGVPYTLYGTLSRFQKLIANISNLQRAFSISVEDIWPLVCRWNVRDSESKRRYQKWCCHFSSPCSHGLSSTCLITVDGLEKFQPFWLLVHCYASIRPNWIAVRCTADRSRGMDFLSWKADTTTSHQRQVRVKRTHSEAFNVMWSF